MGRQLSRHSPPGPQRCYQHAPRVKTERIVSSSTTGRDAAGVWAQLTASRSRTGSREASITSSLPRPSRSPRVGSDALTLEDLARRLATSPRQLQRAFSGAGEPGPRAYLRRVRMTRAAELLENGWSVREAAGLAHSLRSSRRPSAASRAVCRQRFVGPAAGSRRRSFSVLRTSPTTRPETQLSTSGVVVAPDEEVQEKRGGGAPAATVRNATSTERVDPALPRPSSSSVYRRSSGSRRAAAQ